MGETTLRLNMPQWQGGNNPNYHFGSQLLGFLAPKPTGPEETVAIPEPDQSEILSNEEGIMGRADVVRQAKLAKAAIEKHMPERIVTLGGDCLVDLAPIAYLNQKYGSDFGVLWIDSHPDVLTPEHFAHSHAHVLGLLLGNGDRQLAQEVEKPLTPSKVIYAGLNEWSAPEDDIIKRFGLAHVSAAELVTSSDPILKWIKEQGIRKLAVHFDLDVLDPKTFAPLLFNKPDVPEETWKGIPQGKMQMEEVIRLLGDVAVQTDVVGLAIAEHLPWDMLKFREDLKRLPLLS